MRNDRLFTFLQDKIWAIHPPKLEEIELAVDRIMMGERSFDLNLKGRSGNRASDRFEITKDGIAILPVMGVIDRKANLFTEFSGGTSIDILQQDFDEAIDDPEVKGIFFDGDTPGGDAQGPQDFAHRIFEARGKKPTVAFTDGMVASAGYWILSAADELVGTSMSEWGSIGVAAVHYDRSEKDKMWGIKRTDITAGKYKRITSDAQPLTEEGKAYIQEQVDYVYTEFIDSVAKNLGVDSDAVLKMADGKIFMGKKAKNIGLIHVLCPLS